MGGVGGGVKGAVIKIGGEYITNSASCVDSLPITGRINIHLYEGERNSDKGEKPISRCRLEEDCGQTVGTPESDPRGSGSGGSGVLGKFYEAGIPPSLGDHSETWGEAGQTLAEFPVGPGASRGSKVVYLAHLMKKTEGSGNDGSVPADIKFTGSALRELAASLSVFAAGPVRFFIPPPQ
ncbi:hypothetical protein BaRGS_00030035, partial [Batillaria attramentaria]